MGTVARFYLFCIYGFTKALVGRGDGCNPVQVFACRGRSNSVPVQPQSGGAWSDHVSLRRSPCRGSYRFCLDGARCRGDEMRLDAVLVLRGRQCVVAAWAGVAAVED